MNFSVDVVIHGSALMKGAGTAQGFVAPSRQPLRQAAYGAETILPLTCKA